MAVEYTHPLYDEYWPIWDKMEDAVAGEEAVKAAGPAYLPYTPGQLLDGAGVLTNSVGQKNYNAYRNRAVFHEFPGASVAALLGTMHRKPADFELPAKMEVMRKRASVHGESLQTLLRHINKHQLTQGRIGLMADLPTQKTTGAVVPYIATYAAKDIRNWDNGSRDQPVGQKLNLVVLDETESVRDGYQWKESEKYRVLFLGDLDANEEAGVYRQALVTRKDDVEAPDYFEPMLAGQRLDEIPFVFINTTHHRPDPEPCPLRGLVNLSLSIYRLEADYRENLFMQGQETFVVTGLPRDQELRVGAQASLILAPGGKAEYVGVSAAGLAEQRQAVQQNKIEAAKMSGQLIDTTSRQRESGEALKQRAGASTATLPEIVETGATGLELSLKQIARWMDLDEDKVVVSPNRDFTDTSLTGKDLLDYEAARAAGAPISSKTVHDLARRGNITSKSYEEELAEIDEEATIIAGTRFGGDPEPEPEPTEEPDPDTEE